MVTSPPIPEYHLGASPTYEEDSSEEASTAMSCAPDILGLSRARQVEVINRHPYFICTPYVP